MHLELYYVNNGGEYTISLLFILALLFWYSFPLEPTFDA